MQDTTPIGTGLFSIYAFRAGAHRQNYGFDAHSHSMYFFAYGLGDMSTLDGDYIDVGLLLMMTQMPNGSGRSGANS